MKYDNAKLSTHGANSCAPQNKEAILYLESEVSYQSYYNRLHFSHEPKKNKPTTEAHNTAAHSVLQPTAFQLCAFIIAVFSSLIGHRFQKVYCLSSNKLFDRLPLPAL